MSNVDYERLAWISERYKNTFRHDETYQIAREILITIADWMDHEARPGSTVTADTLRAIANAKPDPLDELSPEDRLGYVFSKVWDGEEIANRIYVSDRENWIHGREHRTALAAAVVAEYERQKGGDK